jgi:hypothetical protein
MGNLDCKCLRFKEDPQAADLRDKKKNKKGDSEGKLEGKYLIKDRFYRDKK